MTAEPRNGYRNALNRVGATPLLMAAALYWLIVQFILFCFNNAERKLAFHT